MKQFRVRVNIACLLVGFVTSLAGYSIVKDGVFSMKNLVILLACCGIVVLVSKKD